MATIGLLVGTVFLTVSIVIWLYLRRYKALGYSGEDIQLVGFGFAYVGLWFFLLCGFIVLTKKGIIPLRLNLITGLLAGLMTGVITALFNFIFWISAPDRYAHKQTPEEAIGGVGLAVITGFFSVFIGVVIGIILGIFAA